MDWLIEAIGYCALAWMLGKFLGHIFDNWLEQQATKELVEEAIASILKVHIRSQNGIFYAYEVESDEFLGQGSTLEQVVISIRENTKRQHVLFVSSDTNSHEQVVAFLQEKIGKPIDSHVTPGA